ncbi:S4 domain-containing protein [Candidatus Albibeggiatoa sp. nov. BB20]|uniref:RNA-binding S4 domain-containing protein n=1 Tax=Candidatus Albibeggiatoa sp. nov. BB20 TaxID=3162723 RepID=UPI003365AFA9
MTDTTQERTRLDKWLWAARFFKTRSVATDAISGGKVHVNSQRVKPSRDVHLGDEIQVRKGAIEWTVVVQKLNIQRRAATEAQEMYEETAESVKKREKDKQEQKSAGARQHGLGRPTKRERRDIYRLKQL